MENTKIDLADISIIECENKKIIKQIKQKNDEDDISVSFRNLKHIDSISKDSFTKLPRDNIINETNRKDMKSTIHECNETTKYEDCFQSFQTSQITNNATNLTGIDRFKKDLVKNSISNLYISKNIEKSKLLIGKNLSMITKSSKDQTKDFLEGKKNDCDKENNARYGVGLKSCQSIINESRKSTSKNCIIGKSKDEKTTHIYNDEEKSPVKQIKENMCANDSLDNHTEYEDMKNDKELSGELGAFDDSRKEVNYSGSSSSSSSKRIPFAELSLDDLNDRNGLPRCTSKCLKYSCKTARKIINENMYYSSKTERFLVECMMNFYCTCHEDG